MRFINFFSSSIVWVTGLFFMLVMFPLTFMIWLIALPFDKERIVIHWVLVYQSFLLISIIPIWKTILTGKDKINRNETYVIISNHQSILDILFLNSLCQRFKWISKIENYRMPILGWYLRMAGYITVNRGDEDSKSEMLEKSYRCLKNGISIMIFPEGTRSPDNELGSFKRGAFQLALRSNVSILPVLLDGTGDILPKHGVIFSNGHLVRMKVLDPVPPSAFGTDSPEELAQKITAIFARELYLLRKGK